MQVGDRCVRDAPAPTFGQGRRTWKSARCGSFAPASCRRWCPGTTRGCWPASACARSSPTCSASTPTSASSRPSPTLPRTARPIARYDFRDTNAEEPNKRIRVDETGAYWIDYVADVGDGFEPTYTAAYLLAQDSLDVRGAGPLPHGDILIMGGDQCYPQATREEYKKRLLLPFSWAFTVPSPDAQAVRHPRQPRLVRRPDRLRCPVLLGAREARQRQGQHHRRLAMPAAPQLLGPAPAAQLVDLGRRHPVLEVPRFRAGELLRGRRPADGAEGQPDHLPRRAVLAAGRPEGRGRGGELLQDHGHRPLPRRPRRRRDRRRLAQLQPLFRQRARRAFHHLGRRRRLPASHARAAQLDLGALARTPGDARGGRPADDQPASGRGDQGQALRHPPEAQHQGGRERRRAGRAGHQGRRDRSPAEGWAVAPAQAPAAAAAGPQVLSRQEPKLPAQPRQRVLPVLQSGLRPRASASSTG